MTTIKNGIITTPFSPFHDSIRSLVTQPDGKFVVAGVSGFNGVTANFALARYNVNGSLDNTFDGDGKVTTSIGSGDTQARAIITQADGKFVAAGFTTNETSGNWDFAVARYNNDGSLDNTFDNDGIVTTAIGSSNSRSNAMTTQLGDKIVVAGYSHNGTSDDFTLIRYNNDGSIDTTFGQNGIVTTDFDAKNDYVRSMMTLPDGKLVAAGYSGTLGPTSDFALARYNVDGSLDTSFGNGGKVMTNIGSDNNENTVFSMVVQPDGKVVLAGYADTASDRHDFALVRYNTDGSLDASFGDDGIVTTMITPDDDEAQSLTLQADGKLVAAGYSVDANGTNDFSFVRYNTDGSLDTSFDDDGIMVTTIGPSSEVVYSIIAQANDKLVAAGFSFPDANSVTGDFAIVRYNNDGSLDSSFNAGQPIGVVLSGTSARNLLQGDVGNDIVNGKGGNDTLSGGAGKDKLHGGFGNDVLKGQAGNDVLNGGLGSDVLSGGAGKDTFIFNTALNTTGIDKITDFQAINDTIKLENAVFTHLTTTGALDSAHFVTGATAVDSNDFIVYNDTTGALFYDADGNGSGAAVQIALIGTHTHPVLTAADFVVI